MPIPRVFISYARSDGEPFAVDLRRRLEREHPDLPLWQDRAQMEGGVGWWKQIQDALDHVEYMVLVATPNAMQSEMVKKEWRYARQQGVCIYPVRVPGLPLDFNGLPRWMRDVHFYDLDHEWERFILGLKSTCRQERVPFMAPDLPEGFVERPAEYGQLIDHLLDRTRENPLAITTALRGAGGFGKTTLAAALCHDEDVITGFDDGILWVTLGEQPNTVNSLTVLYRALTGQNPGFVNEEEVATHLAEKLADKDCLIVIDDVWNTAHLRPFLRGGERCARLVTTRILDVATDSNADLVRVDEMEPDEAVQMLTRGVELPPKNNSPFLTLAARLGEWPLLLELANGALRQCVQRGETLGGACEYLNKALDKEGVVAFDRRNAEERNQAIARTITISLNLLQPDERTCFVHLGVFPEDIDIPLATVGTLWGKDSYQARRLCEYLDNLSLIKLNLEDGTIRLHDAMRAFIIRELNSLSSLHAQLIDAWGDPHNLPDRYAWQWISYHLVNANRVSDLAKLLFDFKWIQAKLDHTNVQMLIGDYDMVVEPCIPLKLDFQGSDVYVEVAEQPTELNSADQGRFRAIRQSLDLVQNALRLSAHILAQNKSQLWSQLYARLMSQTAPEIQSLLREPPQTPWLRLIAPTLQQGNQVLGATLVGHTGPVNAVATLPDGQRVISASYDRTLKIWDLHRVEVLQSLQGHSDAVTAVVVTGDGKNALSGGNDGVLRVWDLKSGKEIFNQAIEIEEAAEGWHHAITSMALTPGDQNIVFIVSYRVLCEGGISIRHQLMIWDMKTDSQPSTLVKDTGTAVAIMPSYGELLVLASADHGLEVRNLKSGEHLCTMTGHTASISCIAVTSDGKWAVSAANDGVLKVWDIGHCRELHTLSGHVIRRTQVIGYTGRVMSVAVTPDGQYALSGDANDELKVWNLTSGKELSRLLGHTGSVRSIAITPDGRHAISASGDATLKVWNIRRAVSGDESALAIHNGPVNSIAVSPDGRFLVSGSGSIFHSYDDVLKVLHVEQKEIITLKGCLGSVEKVAVTPEGERVISISSDGTIRILDIKTGHELHVIKGLWGFLTSAAITPDAKRVVLASWNNIAVWDTEAGQEVLELVGHSGQIHSISITKDGQYVVSGSDDQTVKIWNLETGDEVHTLVGHNAEVRAVTVTANGQSVISASDDGILKKWELKSGIEELTLVSELRLLNAVGVAPDDRHVFVISENGTLEGWDIVSERVIASFSFDDGLKSCTVMMDGRTIFLGGMTGRIHCLKLEGG